MATPVGRRSIGRLPTAALDIKSSLSDSSTIEPLCPGSSRPPSSSRATAASLRRKRRGGCAWGRDRLLSEDASFVAPDEEHGDERDKPTAEHEIGRSCGGPGRCDQQSCDQGCGAAEEGERQIERNGDSAEADPRGEEVRDDARHRSIAERGREACADEDRDEPHGIARRGIEEGEAEDREEQRAEPQYPALWNAIAQPGGEQHAEGEDEQPDVLCRDPLEIGPVHDALHEGGHREEQPIEACGRNHCGNRKDRRRRRRAHELEERLLGCSVPELLELLRFGEREPQPETQQSQESAEKEPDPPAPECDLGRGQEFDDGVADGRGECDARVHAEEDEPGGEPRAPGRSLDDVGDRPWELSAEGEALNEAQGDHARGGPDAPLRIPRKKAERERRGGHDEDREDKHPTTTIFVAEVAEDDPAHQPRHIAEREHRVGQHQTDEGAFRRSEEGIPDVLGESAVDDEIVEFERAAEARQYDGAPLGATYARLPAGRPLLAQRSALRHLVLPIPRYIRGILADRRAGRHRSAARARRRERARQEVQAGAVPMSRSEHLISRSRRPETRALTECGAYGTDGCGTAEKAGSYERRPDEDMAGRRQFLKTLVGGGAALASPAWMAGATGLGALVPRLALAREHTGG